VLLGISPMIWRHLLVRSNHSIADLHHILHIAMGWTDTHVHQFCIHGKTCGIARPGASAFVTTPGERLSTGIVESTGNQVISKGIMKKQPMRWSPRGALLLLQVQTRILNEELCSTFDRQYVKFDTGSRGQEESQVA
jgi:hypothetical protein